MDARQAEIEELRRQEQRIVARLEEIRQQLQQEKFDELTDILSSGQGSADYAWPMVDWKQEALRELVGGMSAEEKREVRGKVMAVETSPEANEEAQLGEGLWLPQEKDFVLGLLDGREVAVESGGPGTRSKEYWDKVGGQQ